MGEGALIKYLWSKSNIWSYPGSNYVVVARDTAPPLLLGAGNAKERLDENRQYILNNLRVEGLDLNPLIDALFAINCMPIRLRLQSNRGNGYLIDYTGEYHHGSWRTFYKDHPNAAGMAEVSRPVYDDRTGILLIYVGTHRESRAGMGILFVFRYEGEILIKLAEAELWIS